MYCSYLNILGKHSTKQKCSKTSLPWTLSPQRRPALQFDIGTRGIFEFVDAGTSKPIVLSHCTQTTRPSQNAVHRATVRHVKPNTHRRRRRDETVLSRRRRRCEYNSQLAHDDCRRILSTIWKLMMMMMMMMNECSLTWRES